MIYIFQIINFFYHVFYYYALNLTGMWSEVEDGAPFLYEREGNWKTHSTPPHPAAISNCWPHKSEIAYSGFSQAKQESS